MILFFVLLSNRHLSQLQDRNGLTEAEAGGGRACVAFKRLRRRGRVRDTIPGCVKALSIAFLGNIFADKGSWSRYESEDDEDGTNDDDEEYNDEDAEDEDEDEDNGNEEGLSHGASRWHAANMHQMKLPPSRSARWPHNRMLP